MYKRKIQVCQGKAPCHECNPFTKGEKRLYRPLSFYVRGGVDLNGDTKRVGPPAHFDDAETIAAGEVDIATDPTNSKLDIVAYAQNQYLKESEKRALKEISGTE